MNESHQRTSADGGVAAGNNDDDQHHDHNHSDFPNDDELYQSEFPTRSNLEVRSTLSNGLDGFRDARKIIQLIQCAICSRPLSNPMTFPCGNSLCRACVPPTFQRQSISYPDVPGRREGLLCPFPDCGKEHALADCCMDFTLMKVMEAIEDQIREHMADVLGCGASRLLRGYRAARAGSLPYDGEDGILLRTSDDNDGSDATVLEAMKIAANLEMDCQVCYQLLFDPVTPHCGHTFCRRCLQQVLDHSPLCPTCRQPLQLPAVLPQSFGNNKRITEILTGLCSDVLAQRAAVVTADDRAGSIDDQGLATPVFVCTVSFPSMPTPLFIFEPRYRLMIRRAWEDDRKFGMILPNRTGEPQGDLGVTPFMQYGTLLHIEAIHVYPDGRSHIWTQGVSKFKIKRWGYRDEYLVCDTERLDDLPVAEEEALEASQTSAPSPSLDPAQPPTPSWTRLPTASLLRVSHAFVDRMRASSAPWLTDENFLVFGQPPMDAATFPYWLASILPVTDEEKYRLIECQSVRGRLIVAVSWIKRIESQRWFVIPSFVPSVYSASSASSSSSVDRSSSSSSSSSAGAPSDTSSSTSTESSGFAGGGGGESAVIC